jgi:hypothetical protein
MGSSGLEMDSLAPDATRFSNTSQHVDSDNWEMDSINDLIDYSVSPN